MSKSSKSKTLQFNLNGTSVSHTASIDRSVLRVLREDMGLISLKKGCAPQGVCGCCAVLIDGKTRLSCTLSFKTLEGKSVTTLDGLSEDDRSILADSFVEAGGSQCGYCTPGIALQTHALLEKNPDPTDAEIDKALNMHICRCTGWVKIRDSIHHAAALKRGDKPEVNANTSGVGGCLARDQGREQVLGERPYIDDMTRPGMLHGAVVWTPHPKCKITNVDVSKALSLKGVTSVLVAEDFDGDRKVGLIYRDWPVMIGVGEETNCSADIIAVVAAETRDIALEARDLIEVTSEELVPVTDLVAASEDPANLLKSCNVVKGDVDKALESCAHVVSETFQTQVIDQAFLEPEATLVVPTIDGGVHIYSCGQGVFDDKRQLVSVLGLPEDKVVVELVATGGAFGAKEDLNLQPHAAKLALMTGRPVKIALTLEESLRYHPKRHPTHIEFTLGANESGEFVAVKTRILGDTGGYASVGDKVLERAAGHACGPYKVPNVNVEALTIKTNNPVCGAMRGFGVNQIAFAMEGCIDRLSDKLGIDKWDIRWQNSLDVGDRFCTGQKMDESVGIRATLKALRSRYLEAVEAGHHVGLACAVKNTGMGNGLTEVGKTVLEVHGPGHVVIKTGFTEMGQGHDTVMRQFAATATGLSDDIFTVECDTSVMVDTGMTTASRATYLGGNAVKAASKGFNAALKRADGDLGKLSGQSFAGDWTAPPTHVPGNYSDDIDPVTHYAFGWATQLAIVDADGKLLEIVAAHDVGKAINPVLCSGQIEGAVHMGIGYALSEELVVTDGMPDQKFRNLGILKARHTPKISAILVEHGDAHGPWGAKGVGEIGLVPTAPAIAGAMYSFDKIWRTVLPMKDSVTAKSVGVKLRKR